MKYQRELTAAVLIPAVLAVLIAAPTWGFSLLVAAASSVALVEFYGLLLAAGWFVPRLAGGALFLGLLVAAHLRDLTLLTALAAASVVLLPALVLFASPRVEVLLPSSAGSVFATLYVAAGGAAIIGLRAIGWKPVLFLFAVVWAGDSAAYYSGRRWGRAKLAPVVSPKKTWAGFYGQLVAGGLLGLAVGFLTGNAAMAALAMAGTGVAVSVVAVVGDLVESTFKRSCAVKDSGGLLPGHGGLLDRLDSLLYASPVLLLLVILVPGALPR